jgi:hypothetical protein
MGTGILVYGGTDNVVARNLIFDHEHIGIALLSRLEEDPNDDIASQNDKRPCREARQDPPVDPADIPDSLEWDPRGNRVTANVVTDSGIADLAVATFAADGSGLGNCFANNQFASSAPSRLETLAPCDGRGRGDWSAGALGLAALLAGDRPPEGDYKTTPVPAPQQNMPNADRAPARPATNEPPQIDLKAIDVPPKP